MDYSAGNGSRGGISQNIRQEKDMIDQIIQGSFQRVSEFIDAARNEVENQSIETNFDQTMHNHFKILTEGMSALKEKTTLLCSILDEFASEQAMIDNRSA